MANCDSCNTQLAFLETMKSLMGVKRCNQCIARFAQAKDYWANLVEQNFNQGGVPIELEQAVYRNFQAMSMPIDVAQPVIDRLKYLRSLSEIRWGNVPRIRVDVHLDTDEYAHFDMPTTYHKPNKNVKYVPGRLVGSNKKLCFLSSTGRDSATISWDNVSRIQETYVQEPLDQSSSMRLPKKAVHITVSKGAGGGVYSVNDSLYAKTIMDTLVRLWKRQIVFTQEQKTHGAIPGHVKAAVHHRDKGVCRQCGYTGEYIEYDHVVPRSKGGQNTVENIQLLCRKCNLRKGNKL